MNTRRLSIISIVTIALIGIAGSNAWADRDKDRGREPERREYKERKETQEHRPYQQRYDYRKDPRRDDRNYILDQRHRHDRYYPRPGYVTRQLPRGYYRVPYRSHDYYFYDGIWYSSRSGVEFTVIAPPIGVVIPVLPNFYTTVLIGGTTYYYADGVYYRWYPDRSGYIVVEEPQGVDTSREEVIPEELFVYPRAGQSDAQMAKDRYECHRWAVEQTGFDPTKPLGGVPADQNAQKRSDYNRATKSCLEARNYSVQ